MNAVSDSPLHWDPYNPTYFADPYPVFRRLREEAPVYYNEEYDFYALSRYADVERTLSDRDTFTSGRGSVLEMIKSGVTFPRGVIIFEDPPLHTIHRGVLTKVFTPKKMGALEPQIRAFCARALDHLVDGGEFDFIGDLGKEMPIRVIGMLLGIPEEDLKSIQASVDEGMRTETGKPGVVNLDTYQIDNFVDYINWRAKNPSDDLMTQLINTEIVDETGVTRTLTFEEIITSCTILAGAGNETTNRLIGWTAKILAEHPDQRRELYENRALIPQAIEEILRFEPPGPAISRYVEKDVEFHGVTIPAGSSLCCITASANRDDRVFERGDTFDIHRERKPHMTFGHGFHACLGNALARLEGRVALDEILTRFPEWDVDLDNAYFSSTSTVRGWETLPGYTPKAKAAGRPIFKAAKAAAASGAAAAAPKGEVWKVTLKTPMGPQEMTLQVERDGDRFTGRIDSPMGSETIGDGAIKGDTLSWSMDVKQPMAIKVSFEATVTGDAMKGAAKLGMFGKADLTGQRVSG
jgi:cytochrome P450